MSGKQHPLSDEDYKSILTPIQYEVSRNKATERAFTGEYWNVTDSGVYKCICCGIDLFSSDTIYPSVVLDSLNNLIASSIDVVNFSFVY